MRRSAVVVATVVLAAFTSACAGPKFYELDAQGRKTETGIKIYPPRIFVVVSYTGAKDHPVEVTVVRVPDLGATPIYASEVRGWGGGELSLDFDGGLLKSVGGKSNSQPADTVDALGSLVSAAADVAKVAATPLPEVAQPAFRLYELVMQGKAVTLVPVPVKASDVK
jgi:hypothetical protein